MGGVGLGRSMAKQGNALIACPPAKTWQSHVESRGRRHAQGAHSPKGWVGRIQAGEPYRDRP